MSLASVCAEIEDHNRAIVRAQTWGHLEATDMQRHHGWFTFIHGQHGDMVVIESHFPTFGEGPGYFEDRQEFIWNKVKNGSPCSAVGVYRFDGSYKMYSRYCGKGIGYFKGRVSPVKLMKQTDAQGPNHE